MQLVIDIGNTRVKAAVFEGKALKHFFVYGSAEELLKADPVKMYDITHCIICSVVNEIGHLVKELQRHTSVILFDHTTPLPVKNLYRSAATLGSDRLASAIGANSIARDENILVVDAGTCIKYNFVNAANEYIGGGISPGLQMRFRSMKEFTSRLPLLQADPNFDELVGTDTAGSMVSGVQTGVVAEVEGVISLYAERFNNLKVFLTGGDSDFFAKRLKKPIFADQFLILKGLNEILERNK